MNPNRQPEGAPNSTGGQFAPSAKPVADTSVIEGPGQQQDTGPTDAELDRAYDEWADEVGYDPLEKEYGETGAYIDADSCADMFDRAAGALSEAGLAGTRNSISALVDTDGYVTVSVHEPKTFMRRSAPMEKSWRITDDSESPRENMRSVMRFVHQQATEIQEAIDRDEARADEMAAMNLELGMTRFRACADYMSGKSLMYLSQAAYPSRTDTADQADGIVTLVNEAPINVQNAYEQEVATIAEIGTIEYAQRRAEAVDSFLDDRKALPTFQAHGLQLACPNTTEKDRLDLIDGRIDAAEFARRSIRV